MSVEFVEALRSTSEPSRELQEMVKRRGQCTHTRAHCVQARASSWTRSIGWGIARKSFKVSCYDYFLLFVHLLIYRSFCRACEKYAAAKLLVESVLVTASEPSDKRVLQGFARMFADQFTQCEKAKTSLLEYGEAKVGSPASTSSVESYRNRSISH